METTNLTPGSADWHAHRAQHRNASDAPALLDCSPYETRQQLLRRVASGISKEVDAGTQRRFDEGHRIEALARPIAEEIIGEDLAPVVGTLGKLSASFDGLTFMADVDWECKTANDDLRAALPNEGRDSHARNDAKRLPKQYRTQMEQQLHVSAAERCLFTAARFNPDSEVIEERHAWYYPDAELRAEILRAWEQFEKDLAAYVPPTASAVEKIVAEPVQALPAPVVTVAGQLTLQDNFKVFEQKLREFLKDRLIREPKTDDDFVNLDAQIKAMKQAREALKAAEAQMLAQVQPVDQAKKTKDMLDSLLQQNVSMAEKLLKDEKERRKCEIVAAAAKALADHIQGLNRALGGAYMPTILADFGGCIKGLKSLASMEDKVAGELARAKIAANDAFLRIQSNLNTLRQYDEHRHLFPDVAAIVQKAPEDLQALVTARIAQHRAAEERRLEAERARIRAEEEARAQAKARAEQQEREAAERRQREEQEAAARAEELRQAALRQAAELNAAASAAERALEIGGSAVLPPGCEQPVKQQHPAAPAANVHPMPTRAPTAAPAPRTLTATAIAQRLGFALPVAFIADKLGVAGEKEGPATKFSEPEYDRICAALIAHVTNCLQKKAA